jgi:branched-chain amino acid transport system substrate-binding protein
MGRLVAVAIVLFAAALGPPARAEVLIGMAGPLTGKSGWFGEQLERGAAMAVADINAAGGVLGQQVELITADDFCDPEQAVAAARKLVSDGAIFVVGHFCSHASIPASEIYQTAGVLMISPASQNSMLTELGRANVFRVIYRGDADAVVAGNYLADHWADKKIAILHDNTTWGKGVAEGTRRQLRRLGLTEAIYQAYVPGKVNYGIEIEELQKADIAVVYIGGYHTEVALIALAARDRGYPVQLVASRVWRPRNSASSPVPQPKERSSLMSQIRADAPKRRPSSRGSERQVSNRRVTRCTLMAPFRCGRRPRRKPAPWSCRR